jgi:hypothetical protein
MLAGLGAVCLELAGCASPAQRVFDAAAASGFEPLTLKGGGFQLAAFYKPGRFAGVGALHVYLEGDGTPWETRWQVAEDPTPRNPVMLKLMAMDPAPALYLGRPCYYGHAQDAGCSPELWTGRRYGPEVVDSLEAGLRGFLRRQPSARLDLLGHSGGGALAVLLAPRFPEAAAVVTLAGNLDVAAWTAYHHYSPLAGSLNPAQINSGGCAEYHYLGARDAIIPPGVFAPIAENRSPRRTVIFPEFDHSCCWGSIWGTILRQLDGAPRYPGRSGSAPREDSKSALRSSSP